MTAFFSFSYFLGRLDNYFYKVSVVGEKVGFTRGYAGDYLILLICVRKRSSSCLDVRVRGGKCVVLFTASRCPPSVLIWHLTCYILLSRCMYAAVHLVFIIFIALFKTTRLHKPCKSKKIIAIAQVKVKVAQLCPNLCNPMVFAVHGILQARILEWAAIPFSRQSSQPRDRIQVSHIAGGFFTIWATREAQVTVKSKCLTTGSVDQWTSFAVDAAQ